MIRMHLAENCFVELEVNTLCINRIRAFFAFVRPSSNNCRARWKDDSRKAHFLCDGPPSLKQVAVISNKGVIRMRSVHLYCYNGLAFIASSEVIEKGESEWVHFLSSWFDVKNYSANRGFRTYRSILADCLELQYRNLNTPRHYSRILSSRTLSLSGCCTRMLCKVGC